MSNTYLQKKCAKRHLGEDWFVNNAVKMATLNVEACKLHPFGHEIKQQKI